MLENELSKVSGGLYEKAAELWRPKAVVKDGMVKVVVGDRRSELL